MHAFILIPVLASITASLAHSKMLHSRQPCSNSCPSPSLLLPPAWLTDCLVSTGCPQLTDVCSIKTNIEDCVCKNKLLNQTERDSLLSLLYCPDTDDNAARQVDLNSIVPDAGGPAPNANLEELIPTSSVVTLD
ncbi:hypothetical protein C8Q73DRAFT_49919 [Cubamyces lactineus]|nr:hypothetical protein C8Q73DRAFT_49919 [Cubamyces lactineus]